MLVVMVAFFCHSERECETYTSHLLLSLDVLLVKEEKNMSI